MSCLVLAEGCAQLQDIEAAEGLVADRTMLLRNIFPVTGKKVANRTNFQIIDLIRRLGGDDGLGLVFE